MFLDQYVTSIQLWGYVTLFIISIAVLIKSSDVFTDAAEKLGVTLGIPPFLIGVIVVSIGTSLPELASSIAAVIAGKAELVAGNVIGSNIANSLLVLGLGAIVAGKLSTKWDVTRVDFPLLFGATFLLTLMALNGSFTIIETLILLAGYGVYIHYLLSDKKAIKHQSMHARVKKNGWNHFLLTIILPLVAGGVLIYFGAKYTVDSVVGIATLLSVPVAVIAVTAVALGTSLPELSVTIVAALKGKHDIAIGNVIGSNIFNIFAVMGVAGLFGSLPISGSILTFALPMLIAATFMLYIVVADKEVTKWEGWILFLLYGFFVARMFVA